MDFKFPTNYQPQGERPQTGVILAANCNGASCETVPNVGLVGLPEHLTYRVAISTQSGAPPTVFDDITPANRRPNCKVIAAKPNDLVTVHWLGLEVYCLIIEAPYFKPCNE